MDDMPFSLLFLAQQPGNHSRSILPSQTSSKATMGLLAGVGTPAGQPVQHGGPPPSAWATGPGVPEA